MKYVIRPVLGFLVLAFAIAVPASAGVGCCDRCGYTDSHKVCRLKCTYKEVKVTCWSSECKDFCVPGPCPLLCRDCDGRKGDSCDTCAGACDDGCADCGAGKRGAPRHARIRTKKSLRKKVVTKKVPIYEWVIEDLCGDCDARADTPTVPATAVIPKPPAVDAEFHYGKVGTAPVRLQLSDGDVVKKSGSNN